MLEKLLQRIRSAHRSRAPVFTLPGLILEIQPGFVLGARLNGSARSPRRVGRMAVSELESGALQAFFNRPNVSAQAELYRAVRSVTEAVGNGDRRLGLLIPDGAVRVATLSFEALPDNPNEAAALVRWRMKDVLPFPPDEATVSYQIVSRQQESIELLAVAAKTSVLREYESAFEPLDSSPVLVLPATVALLPLLPEDGGAGQLLVHVCSGWVTVVVAAGGGVRLWRCRQVGELGVDDLAGEVASELDRVLAGAGDHLKVEIGRIWLCARSHRTPELCSELARRTSREVHPLVPEEGLASTLPSAERPLFDRLGASVAGLISNVS